MAQTRHGIARAVIILMNNKTICDLLIILVVCFMCIYSRY
ncbi:hypothetical protein EDWATA_00585 [Edwardsiella tarda ATCC 23685]|uniref:Uncharacterized protein n=1 Tax=Edwardsiella tarda ATCC 23685 TaxID=500638 RepID=D4F1J5_EDWTA|nr:hypothetical protein EDWATA_00585 [Edwardsiella tarda ATCC 23685]